MKRIVLVSMLLLVIPAPIILSHPMFGVAQAAGGPVYIRPDGAIQGLNIQRNGDVYTFAGDVEGPLYVEKDDIVIDGAGHSLVGGNNRGIVLEQRHGVTVKNAHITLNTGTIVNLQNTTDCALIGNTLIGTPTENPWGWVGMVPIAVNCQDSQNLTIQNNVIRNFFIGLSLDWSSSDLITGNTFSDGVEGVEIENSTDCVFRDNHLTNCSFHLQTSELYEYGYQNDLDTSNLIDGRPIYYYVNARDMTVPNDAAYIVLVDCKNIMVEDSSPKGIHLVSTTNSTVSHIMLAKTREGIGLLDCSKVSIVNCILDKGGVGLDIANSRDNLVSGNYISGQTTGGIRLFNADNNVFSGNIFINNSYGIRGTGPSTSSSSGNSISVNNFTRNEYAVNLPSNTQANGNFFEGNSYAIEFYGSSGSTVTQNTFLNNRNALYFTGELSYRSGSTNSSSGNRIHHNNFLTNYHQVTDEGVSPATQANHAGSSSLQLVAGNANGVNYMPPPAPSINQYDDGAEGNYWVDYHGLDSNGDGIGDTVYYLYENNQDNHPLMRPVPAPQVPSTSLDLSSFAQGSPAQSPAPITPEDTIQGSIALQYAVVVIVVVVSVSIVSAGLLIYRRKRGIKAEQGAAGR